MRVISTADIVRRSPLRKIVSIIKKHSEPTGPNRVALECGHEALAWGRTHARCVKCWEAGMASLFGKRQHVALASWLASTELESRASLAQSLGAVLQLDSPKTFNMQRWLKACGVRKDSAAPKES